MKRLFWALIGTLTVIATSTLPASAAPAGDPYRWMNCAAGTFTGSYSEAHFVGNFVAMTGTLQPCRFPSSKEVYGLGVYRANGTAWGKSATMTGGEILFPGFQADVSLTGDVVAVCVLGSETLRLDCVGVISTLVNGSYTYALGARLPTNSPLVSAPATTSLPATGWFNGGEQCPACWEPIHT